jgi:D-methionine transport system ATP-binding protein
MQVIKQIAHRVAVLDAGEVVEEGETLSVFSQPAHEVTRSLLDDVTPRELPPAVLERVRALLGAGGAGSLDTASLLRLVFAGHGADRPLLSDLVRRYGLDLNIVHGQVDEVQGHPFGTLAVLARGAQEQLQAAIGHLRGAGVQVQEIREVAHA